MKRNSFNIIIFIHLIILLLYYFLHTSFIIENIINYSISFFKSFFPVSFLLNIIIFLLLDYEFIPILSFIPNISTSFLLFIFSFFSGFPTGSKMVCEFLKKGYCNKDEANSYLYFSHFPNPFFILGVVSPIINNYLYTIYLYLSLILSNYILYFFFSKKKRYSIIKPSFHTNFSLSLNNSIQKSFSIILLVYGISLYFYIISTLYHSFFPCNSYFYVLINGLFDLTNGVLSSVVVKERVIRALLILSFLSFGTISIHMQTSSILKEEGLSYSYYIKGRIMSLLLSILFFLLLVSIPASKMIFGFCRST